jgi:hypothetical protein
MIQARKDCYFCPEQNELLYKFTDKRAVRSTIGVFRR